MISNSLKSINFLCIIGYLAFISLAIDLSVLDALVFFINEQDGQSILTTASVQTKTLAGKNDGQSRLQVLQFLHRRISALTGAHISTSGQVTEVSSGSLQIEKEKVRKVSGLSASETTDAKTKTEEIILIENEASATFVAPLPASQSEQLSADEGEEDDVSDREGEPNAALQTIASSKASDTALSIASMRPSKTAVAVNVCTTTSKPNLPNKAKETRSSDQSSISTVTANAAKTQNNSNNQASKRNLANSNFSLTTKETSESDTSESPSILTLLKALPERNWIYHPGFDRYVVRYDSDTLIVLTIRPALQKLVESLFLPGSCRLGAAIVQDPSTGAILAMTSFDGKQTLSPVDPEFKTANWALQPTFPIASLFKIITAAAGIEKGRVSPTSVIKLGRKWHMPVWEAFAKSNNTVFGVIGKSLGRSILQSYAEAFGFNKPFFFDLPVASSRAEMPLNTTKLGEASAGLDRTFEISPIHAISIVSTIINGGRRMKPYLVDYVVKGNRVIFRRKPFPLAQPISASTAKQIYEMMKTTTTHGTGKRSFKSYQSCQNLAQLCGGKTGTLTGIDPHLLFTWFGGFTRVSGRDLSVVFLVGQPGFSRLRASTLAAQFAYELFNGKAFNFSSQIAAR